MRKQAVDPFQTKEFKKYAMSSPKKMMNDSLDELMILIAVGELRAHNKSAFVEINGKTESVVIRKTTTGKYVLALNDSPESSYIEEYGAFKDGNKLLAFLGSICKRTDKK